MGISSLAIRVAPQPFQDLLDAFENRQPEFVLIVPGGPGFGVARKDLAVFE